eukprot:scaffold112649_cov72-Phaeocystis_antarctica.AAC.6
MLSSCSCPRSKARRMYVPENARATPLRACAHRGSELFIVNIVGTPQKTPFAGGFDFGSAPKRLGGHVFQVLIKLPRK